MLISYVKLDHTLYQINMVISDNRHIPVEFSKGFICPIQMHTVLLLYTYKLTCTPADCCVKLGLSLVCIYLTRPILGMLSYCNHCRVLYLTLNIQLDTLCYDLQEIGPAIVMQFDMFSIYVQSGPSCTSQSLIHPISQKKDHYNIMFYPLTPHVFLNFPLKS